MKAAEEKGSVSRQTHLLGVDAGGTFTDFVYFDGYQLAYHKVASTPSQPAAAILQGIDELGLRDVANRGLLQLVHGSTVATNAVLEGKLAKTAYVTNLGLKDVLRIGRQNRAELFNMKPAPQEELAGKDLCFEVPCRRDAQGHNVLALEQKDIDRLLKDIERAKPESVAINLLFSFLNNDEEQRLMDAIDPSIYVSISSLTMPEYKEYERGVVTYLNAGLGPVIRRYLNLLAKNIALSNISIMQSNGGLADINHAKRLGVSLLLSGPAGGLSAIQYVAQQLGLSQLLSFDMGGTSTDVSLMDEDVALSQASTIAGWPIALPMLDIQTIGAGGGSIAWLDEAGMLHVGPESAGAEPGPVCYGKGGKRITVTDANVYLGRIHSGTFLGGRMKLDMQALETEMQSFAEAAGLSPESLAEGIIAIAEQHMTHALRKQSIDRGLDPKDFSLCSFGGAGGLHACSMAEQLQMSRIIIPAMGGVLSALGMIVAPQKRLRKQSLFTEWDHSGIQRAVEKACKAERELLAEFSHVAQEDLVVKQLVELRYQGQSEGILVSLCPDSDRIFVEKHKSRFGHVLDYPIETVSVLVEVICSHRYPPIETHTARFKLGTAKGELPKNMVLKDAMAVNEIITGPLIIIDSGSTVWLKAGWLAKKTADGHLDLTKDT